MERNEVEIGMKVKVGTEIYTVEKLVETDDNWVQLSKENDHHEYLCSIPSLRKVHICRLNRRKRNEV